MGKAEKNGDGEHRDIVSLFVLAVLHKASLTPKISHVKTGFISPVWRKNRCAVPPPLYGTVDAAICCLDSLNYLTCPKDVQKTFQRLHLFIAPGGLPERPAAFSRAAASMSGLASAAISS